MSRFVVMFALFASFFFVMRFLVMVDVFRVVASVVMMIRLVFFYLLIAVGLVETCGLFFTGFS